MKALNSLLPFLKVNKFAVVNDIFFFKNDWKFPTLLSGVDQVTNVAMGRRGPCILEIYLSSEL